MLPTATTTEAGADLKAFDYLGWPPAHYSARKVNHACLALLTHAAKKSDPKDLEGITPLLLAVAYEHAPCFFILLGAGANVDAICPTGKTPAMWAAHNRFGEPWQCLFPLVPTLNFPIQQATRLCRSPNTRNAKQPYP